jgi:hypothetical protein
MLKLDSLLARPCTEPRTLLMKARRSLTPSNSRPGSPTFYLKNNGRYATQSPPPKASSISSPPKRTTYSQPASAWDVADEDEEDDEESAEQYFYNDNADEDEFGLPSITSMRREAKKRMTTNRAIDPGGGFQNINNGIGSTLLSEQPLGRPRANSSDIALEREPLSYPSAKTSERKILRPQYKDILRG